MIFSNDIPTTNSSQKWIYQSSTIHLIWMNPPGIFVLSTPFSLYRYYRLPMGVSKAPDIATKIMHDTFADMGDVEFYMDDIGCFSDSWDKHLQLLQAVLQCLQSVGFTINPLRCKWAVKEMDFLGHWVTPT